MNYKQYVYYKYYSIILAEIVNTNYNINTF